MMDLDVLLTGTDVVQTIIDDRKKSSRYNGWINRHYMAFLGGQDKVDSKCKEIG